MYRYFLSKINACSARGFSLIEMLVYLAILMIVVGASLTLLFTLDDRIREQRANQLVVQSAQSTLEHILSSVRAADVVNTVGSTLNTTPGVLALTQGATTTTYAIVNGDISVTRNGVSLGSLTDEAVTVSQLRFFSYDNGDTEFVRVVFTLSAQVGDTTVTKTYRGGATLRGSYE
jgi:type II secretory pathway pseudopilin PulG